MAEAFPLAPQCGVEVMFHKGVGFHIDEPFAVTFYCLRTPGHEGPHIISWPTWKELTDEDNDTGNTTNECL